MTLDTLQFVQTQVLNQYNALIANPAAEGKDSLKFCNAIELRGAMQLLAQLIQQEQAVLAAPPGATGPTL